MENVHVLIPRTCENVSLRGEGKLRLQKELRLLISRPYNRKIILIKQVGPM